MSLSTRLWKSASPSKEKKIRRKHKTKAAEKPKKFYFHSGQPLPPYINFKMSGRIFPKKPNAKRERDEMDYNLHDPPMKRIASWEEAGTSWAPVHFYGSSPDSKTDQESGDEPYPKKHRRKTASNKTKVGEQTPHDSWVPVQSSTSKKSKSNPKEGAVKAASTSPVRIRNIPLPGFSWADSNELSLLMCFKEDVGIKDRDPDVFRKHPNLTPRMRAILLDWLMEVCEVYKMRRITYYLAVDYIDRYLSRIDVLPKHQLQLLGITCLFIASKVEEIYPPKLLELAYVTDGACTDQEMLLKEMGILKELRWDVLPQTVSAWLYLFLQMACSRETVRDTFKRELIDDEFIFPQMSTYAFMRASQLIDLCSLDDGMLQFQYSVIAAGAIYYLSNRETALYVSGLTWDKIRDCVSWMGPFAEIIRRNCLNTPFPTPKEYPRLGSGLKRKNPRIILDEAHTIQTHAVDLAMLEAVYSLANEKSQEYATPGFDNASNLIDNPDDYKYSEKSPVGASSIRQTDISQSNVSSVQESSIIDEILENEHKSHIKLKDTATQVEDNYPQNKVPIKDVANANTSSLSEDFLANSDDTCSSNSSNQFIVDEDYDKPTQLTVPKLMVSIKRSPMLKFPEPKKLDAVKLQPASSTEITNCHSSLNITSTTATTYPEQDTLNDPPTINAPSSPALIARGKRLKPLLPTKVPMHLPVVPCIRDGKLLSPKARSSVPLGITSQRDLLPTDMGSENDGSEFTDSSVDISLSDVEEESEPDYRKTCLISPSQVVVEDGKMYHRDAPSIRSIFFPSCSPSEELLEEFTLKLLGPKPLDEHELYIERFKDSNYGMSYHPASSEEIDSSQQNSSDVNQKETEQSDQSDSSEEIDTSKQENSNDNGSENDQPELTDSNEEIVPNHRYNSNKNRSEDAQPDLTDSSEETAPNQQDSPIDNGSRDTHSEVSDSSAEIVTNQLDSSSDNDSKDVQTILSDSSEESIPKKSKAYRFLSRNVRAKIKKTKFVSRVGRANCIDSDSDSDLDELTENKAKSKYISRVSTSVSKTSIKNTITKTEKYNSSSDTDRNSVKPNSRSKSARRVMVYKLTEKKKIKTTKVVIKKKKNKRSKNNNKSSGNKYDKTFANSPVSSPELESSTGKSSASQYSRFTTDNGTPRAYSAIKVITTKKRRRFRASQKPMGIKRTRRYTDMTRCVIQPNDPLKIKIISEKRSPNTSNLGTPLRIKLMPILIVPNLIPKPTRSKKSPVVKSIKPILRKSTRLKNIMNYSELD